MKAIANPSLGVKRAGALLVVALLILAPAAWIAWSLHATGVAAETIRSQSGLLEKLRARAASLNPEDLRGAAAAAESVFLPGETSALAGAALQRIVADAVEAAGGRVLETEFARVDTAEEDPGRVDLRVSFEADIVSLQKVLLELEAGMPILFMRSLDVQSAAEATEAASPPLRVLMLVGGYAEIPA